VRRRRQGGIALLLLLLEGPCAEAVAHLEHLLVDLHHALHHALDHALPAGRRRPRALDLDAHQAVVLHRLPLVLALRARANAAAAFAATALDAAAITAAAITAAALAAAALAAAALAAAAFADGLVILIVAALVALDVATAAAATARSLSIFATLAALALAAASLAASSLAASSLAFAAVAFAAFDVLQQRVGIGARSAATASDAAAAAAAIARGTEAERRQRRRRQHGLARQRRRALAAEGRLQRRLARTRARRRAPGEGADGRASAALRSHASCERQHRIGGFSGFSGFSGGRSFSGFSGGRQLRRVSKGEPVRFLRRRRRRNAVASVACSQLVVADLLEPHQLAPIGANVALCRGSAVVEVRLQLVMAALRPCAALDRAVGRLFAQQRVHRRLEPSGLRGERPAARARRRDGRLQHRIGFSCRSQLGPLVQRQRRRRRRRRRRRHARWGLRYALAGRGDLQRPQRDLVEQQLLGFLQRRLVLLEDFAQSLCKVLPPELRQHRICFSGRHEFHRSRGRRRARCRTATGLLAAAVDEQRPADECCP